MNRLADKMEALVWEGPEAMTLKDWPDPVPGAGEVLIDVAYVGICGSELGGYLGHNALRVPPLVMGHEFSGTVAAIGEGTETDLKIGDKVTCNPMVPCGECEYCAEGATHLCLSRSLIGAHRPGAFASRVTAPARATYRLPDSVSLQVGAMVEPFAVGIRIGTMAGDLTGKTALVIGAGPIGLLAVQVLKHCGAEKVFCVDLDADRREMARSFGAEVIVPADNDTVDYVRTATDGRGVAVTVDAVGSAQTRAQSVAATRSGGDVLLSGLHAEASDFPASEVIRREIVVRGTFCYSAKDFADALAAAADGSLSLGSWIVEAPLGEGGAWFDRLVKNPGNVSKVLLVPGQAA